MNSKKQTLVALTFLSVVVSLAIFTYGFSQSQVQADSRPSAIAQGEFNNAKTLSDASLTSVVAKDFNIKNTEAAKLDFIRIPQKQSFLYVVKAPPKICGAIGCLFLGYFNAGNTYKQVFSAYLIDRLPAGVNTFIAAKNPECITVHSLKSYSNPSLVSKDFCFKGDRYR